MQGLEASCNAPGQGSLRTCVRRLSGVLGLLVSLLAVSPGALAQTEPVTDEVPSWVRDLQVTLDAAATGGSWDSGESSGFYRVIVVRQGAEHIHHAVYIQWIQWDWDPPRIQLVRTVSVTEITNTLNIYVKNPRFERDSSGTWCIVLDIADTYAPTRMIFRQLRIWPDASGGYRAETIGQWE